MYMQIIHTSKLAYTHSSTPTFLMLTLLSLVLRAITPKVYIKKGSRDTSHFWGGDMHQSRVPQNLIHTSLSENRSRSQKMGRNRQKKNVVRGSVCLTCKRTLQCPRPTSPLTLWCLSHLSQPQPQPTHTLIYTSIALSRYLSSSLVSIWSWVSCAAR